MTLFYCVVGIIIVQRLVELVIAKKNASRMFSLGAVEFDRGGYKYVVAMHTLFFISLLIEKVYLASESNRYFVSLIILLILVQAFRYWSIGTLGMYWNTRIIVLKDSKLIKRGPYKYFSHPNYVCVVTELAVIPMVFNCYITSVVFTILNSIVLYRRISIENLALKELSSTNQK